MKFYRCKHCGNIITKINDSGVPVICCGEPMEELIPGAVEGALEKHIPFVETAGNTVKVQVGEVEHPMLEAHFIQFIAIETSKGFCVKTLSPGDKPVVEFILSDGEKPVAVYEYCNLHGLWVKEC